MPKVRLYIASSLDGYIARPEGEIDWLFHDADYGYTEFYDSIETLLMGRKTYDLTLTFGEYPHADRTSYVFTRTLEGKTDQNVHFVSEPVREFVPKLLARSEKDAWLVGGGELVEEFLREGLIDEIVVSIHPIILGDGIPLFRKGVPSTKLVLRDTKSFRSGLVQLCYEVER